MLYHTDETIVMLKNTVQQFAKKEIVPIASDIDKNNEFPHHLWKMMGDLGILGMTVSEEYGGVNMGYLAHAIVLKEISEGKKG